MSMPDSFTPLDYWHIALRRKWLIVSVFLACAGIAVVLCLILPKSYRSSTLILVESQKIPENYVQAIVGPSIEERLTMIQQQVMSRTLLSKVIDEFELYPEDVRSHGLDSVIELLRRRIKVDTVGSSHSASKGIEAFSISFGHEDPVMAMKVTARLASQFIEENLKAREQLVEGASEFIEQELEMAKERLETQEQAISQFKTKYMGELPEQMEANLRALDRLQTDLNAANDALGNFTDRLGLIEKAIKEYEISGKPSSNVVSATDSALGRVDPLLTRLKELQRNLATLSAEYKDTYPDIVHTKQEIEKLKTQLAEKYGQVDKEGLNSTTPQTFDPYLRELTKQRDDLKIEIASIKERQRRLMSQMKEYEGRVERTPAREQELMVLLRDYDNLQQNYRSLLEKKLNARVAENLEKRQKGEQFRVIDPANIPMKPEKPDQFRIMLMGLLAGCALGFGSAIALEQMQPVFRRPEEVETILGLPLLASIPTFASVFRASTNFLPPQLPIRHPTSNGHHDNALLVTSKAADIDNETNAPAKDQRSEAASWMRLPNFKRLAADIPNELNLVSKWRPWSVVAEQFRVAATRLSLMQAGRESTVIVVTSAVKGEGKSSVAVNLGYVLAKDLGKRTLILDCDLKCPTLHAYAGISRNPGLRNVLNEEHPLNLCLQRLGTLPLWILPCGSSDDEIVELSKMHQLMPILNQLRPQFDYILLDAPPILPLADMHLLSGMADVVVLVIRAGLTHQSIVRKALNTLKPSNHPCVILAGLEAEVVPYYMQESYGYVRREKQTSRI